MRTRTRTAAVGLVMSLSAVGCEGGILGLGGPREVEFRPDRSHYALRASDLGVEVEIPFSYENDTGRTIYVVNCRRIAPPVLEKQVAGEWMVVWSAVVPLCLSAPIVIRDGDTFRDTLRVFAGHPSSNVLPKFEVDEVEGVYRMRWEGVLWSFDGSKYPFGPAVPRELRTSSEFFIEDPR